MVLRVSNLPGRPKRISYEKLANVSGNPNVLGSCVPFRTWSGVGGRMWADVGGKVLSVVGDGNWFASLGAGMWAGHS